MNPPLCLRAVCWLSGISLATAMAAAAITITPVSHLGWAQAWKLGNGRVEAIVVPSVGRVMQFRFVGETNGPFWENPRLAGKPMPAEPWTVAHGSFGGDKTWPAPQSAWDWPPPDVFDSAPLEATVVGPTLLLTSPISQRFGIRTLRRITLVPDAPVMRVVTTYDKIRGDPVEVGVWVITQTQDPAAVFVPVPASSRFPAGTATNWGLPGSFLSRQNGLLRLTRDPKSAHKIGNDAESMVWVGARESLRIDLPRTLGANYPDDGCSVEVYTNPDPVPYVELETLGPLRRLAPGDSLSATNTYSLYRREADDDVAEARRVLAFGTPAP